ncbi:uncharacterized protein SOCE26_064030 [Sorangium cellulosum]|uniref:Uncharacterized protein n=1 Tax=Sorangium cellulosum TaxID=56 RepID=A0A2L0F079_SORCE|nr:uncharacterized protein SOCE26_064030 [Sorangium cellulosum]
MRWGTGEIRIASDRNALGVVTIQVGVDLNASEGRSIGVALHPCC